MIHADPKVQDFIETLHGMLRSLCTELIKYDVRQSFSYYDISIVVLFRERVWPTTQVKLLIEAMREPWWANYKHSIARETVRALMEKCARPVDSRDIEYFLHPACALVDIRTRETETRNFGG